MADEPVNTPLDLEELESLSAADLEQRITRAGNRLVLDLGMSSVGSTNDPSDIASDYLDAMYFGERIAEHCTNIEVRPVDLAHGMLLRFTMTASDAAALAREIRRVARGFALEDGPDQDIRDEIEEFADRLLSKKSRPSLRLPELADSYMANELGGTSYLVPQEDHQIPAEAPWQLGVSLRLHLGNDRKR